MLSLCADDRGVEAKLTKETQSPGTPSLREVSGLERCPRLAGSEGTPQGLGRPPSPQSSGMVGRGCWAVSSQSPWGSCRPPRGTTPRPCSPWEGLLWLRCVL